MECRGRFVNSKRELSIDVVHEQLIAELLARAKRAQSGAPWVRKFG